MDPISNVDRIALLIRQKLEERARLSSGGKERTEKKKQLVSAPLDRVRALSASEGVDERQVRRLFIETILSERLGRDLVNEAGFQQIVGRVVETIEQDEEAAALLTKALQELSRSGS